MTRKNRTSEKKSSFSSSPNRAAPSGAHSGCTSKTNAALSLGLASAKDYTERGKRQLAEKDFVPFPLRLAKFASYAPQRHRDPHAIRIFVTHVRRAQLRQQQQREDAPHHVS
eukprot:scaffold2326_cov286-Pinguiococcus_pyrenoidosus.AAC.13